jgi:hypothetical protein
MTQMVTETPKKAKKSELAILDQTGDTKVMWSKDNPDEVDAAEAQFKTLTRKGYTAYRATGKDGKKGEQIREFDPDAERIILVPPVQAG